MKTSPSKQHRYLSRFLMEAMLAVMLVAMAAGQANQYPYFEVGAIAFAPQERYQVGKGPFSLATLDLNGDGILDLVVPNRDNGNLSILIGRGDGSFELQAEAFPGGNCPIFAAVGDFNLDQKDDLAVINHLCSTLVVFLSAGDGSYSDRLVYPTSAEPRSIVAGDWNGDQVPDLAIANRLAGTISIFPGVGDGTFAPKTDYPASLNPHSIVAGDFNGDGWADLAVANTGTNGVTIFRNLGDGVFSSLPDIPAGMGSTALVAVDLNRDGKLDLVVADVSINSVSVLLGNGDYTFGNLRQYATGGSPFEIRADDFNGDGYPDVVVPNRASNDVIVLLGKGDGTFARTTHLNRFATGTSPYDVVVGDFNLDGKPDLATANFVDNTISVLLNEEPRFADLAVTLDASSATALSGSALTYTIEVTNQGPDPSLNVVVSDLLPAQATFVSCGATDGGICGEQDGVRTVFFPALPVGATATITIEARVNDGVCDGDRLVNLVSVTARTGDPVLEDNQAEMTVMGDNLPPEISGPADMMAVAPRAGDKTGPVMYYPAPVATDNTSGLQVTCTHPSGTQFPVGLTKVTCTATDICGLTDSCSFNVMVWDGFLIDDRSGNIFLFDSFTGNYLFKRMDTGQEYRGRGRIFRTRCEIRLQDDYRANIVLNTCFARGSGTVRPLMAGPYFVFQDSYTRNNRF